MMTHRYVMGTILSAMMATAACSSSSNSDSNEEPLTYWQNVAPIVNAKCVGCHQQGGIAPFALDTYDAVKARAAGIDGATQAGHMPPFLMTHDGSCGDIERDEALTPAELATLHRWASSDKNEGTPVEIPRTPAPVLDHATEYRTPNFVPRADPANPLASRDEYRCFGFRPGGTGTRYITGYHAIPGNPAIVHHAALYVVDPNGASYVAGKTNGQVVQALDDAGTDRDGWPCFGAAGDGVRFESSPAVWVPGQNVVDYPDGFGAPVRPDDLLVLQIHYNLPASGQSPPPDSTNLRLRYQDHVDREVLFRSPDPLLDSLFRPQGPDTLPPGKREHPYSRELARSDLDFTDDQPAVEILGIMPHMHELGRKFELTLHQAGGTGKDECIAHIDQWNFHWQRFYWYKTRPKLTADTIAKLTCVFDTSGKREPVSPGWGTENEMCLGMLMIAKP
ncbi:hypothetical protein LVJ94_32270 [Pendulispora rubella]|uniref:Copper type II ascorbate-dependent monooxygenase C-terminal domain-containing protein n=1 Tax=Pendulispora rubella TaxID=2741070 RepID=A0ABZ2KSF0_9BACT